MHPQQGTLSSPSSEAPFTACPSTASNVHRTSRPGIRATPYNVPKVFFHHSSIIGGINEEQLSSSSIAHQHIRQAIPKPPGEAGRPGRGGYNLQKVLGWSKADYDEVKDFIKILVRRLDCSIPFTEHSLFEIDSIRTKAIARFKFLALYSNDWVVDDFIRSRLKYERTLMRNRMKRAAQGQGF
ncbi:hypothetical protein F5878DRAFT_664938 [Lentinula raphanica]|uniref:Uncharacterized protein n=1 Tax=Lentinula raphanica TaxID=153919 RepID=A0AA38U8Q5_9AGAR|nr:hypothetical protein EV360DRAFT_86349 [Lentinula raphanica]KAJ3834256.1 hypothetical protein F5878DRAFT_664938 [Lentinula raphanica]